MGVICHQMVICITHDFDCNNLSKLDNLVNSYPKLFVKSQVLTNGAINYVMFWDGSKEGWDESDKGDELREEFINPCKQLELADIYEINDHESGTPELKHINTYELRHSTGSAKSE